MGNTQVSYLSTETYNVAQNIGSIFNWYLDNGGIIINGQTTNSIEVQWGGTSGTYELYVIETDIDGDTDMDEEINEIVKDVKKNNTKKKTTDNTEIKDIDYRLNNLNRNMNMLIKKMDNNDFFDDDSNDNIHDLILFILFGVFMIFVLDTVHKLGRN